MKEGDYIVGINEHDVKWSPHDEVVSLIKGSGHSLKLRVVTPMATAPISAHHAHSSRSASKSEKVNVITGCPIDLTG